MDNLEDWERMNLINELVQGMELAKQLHVHLNSPSSSSSSHETREVLATRILASYGKALSMLDRRYPMGEPSPAGVSAGPATFRKSESPPSLGGGGTPPSGDSDWDFRDQELGDAAKKRKAVARWTKHVRVSPEADLEGSLDDGHSWRKYGQKDILGAKFPRGYYRCTHRNIQGCLATKHVQRSDEDPAVYVITYRGRHTCNQSSRRMNPPLSILDQNQELVQQVIEPPPEQNIQQQQKKTSQEILMNFRDLRIIPEELNSQNHPVFPPYNFTPPGNFSTQFASPSGNSDFQGNTDRIGFQISGSDHLAEIVSAATSRASSTMAGLAFDPSNTGFNQNSPFGSPGFFD